MALSKFIPAKEDIDAMEALVNYLILDEERNWEESGKPTKNHIYLEVLRVQKYINKIKTNLKKQ